MHLPVLSKCPEVAKKVVARTTTTMHCIYWGHLTLTEWSFLTPLYGAMVGLTLIAHMLYVEAEA